MTEQVQQKEEPNLHHNLLELPTDKKANDVVGERHEMVLLIEVAKSNPNGDPDTGNMPRMQPDTMKGLITDVCLKRKVRNFFSLYKPDGKLLGNGSQDGYRIFIKENAVLQELMESDDIAKRAEVIFKKYPETNKGEWERAKTKTAGKSEFIVRAYRDALCAAFVDVRTFGGVTSTDGPLRSSFFGQIRGPIQFGFSESLDRLLQLDFSITRCAATSEKEKKQQTEGQSGGDEEGGNRTMGRKHIVDYAIYRCHIYLSPAFAAVTGFTYYDLDNFLFALKHMFTDDRAAPRTGMRIVGLIDFQHSTALGNEHAHKLFEMVEISRADAIDPKTGRRKDFPQSIADYRGDLKAMKFEDAKREDPCKIPFAVIREKDEGGDGKALVIARKIVWEFTETAKKEKDAKAVAEERV